MELESAAGDGRQRRGQRQRRNESPSDDVSEARAAQRPENKGWLTPRWWAEVVEVSVGRAGSAENAVGEGVGVSASRYVVVRAIPESRKRHFIRRSDWKAPAALEAVETYVGIHELYATKSAERRYLAFRRQVPSTVLTSVAGTACTARDNGIIILGAVGAGSHT